MKQTNMFPIKHFFLQRILIFPKKQKNEWVIKIYFIYHLVSFCFILFCFILLYIILTFLHFIFTFFIFLFFTVFVFRFCKRIFVLCAIELKSDTKVLWPSGKAFQLKNQECWNFGGFDSHRYLFWWAQIKLTKWNGLYNFSDEAHVNYYSERFSWMSQRLPSHGRSPDGLWNASLLHITFLQFEWRIIGWRKEKWKDVLSKSESHK